MIAIDQAGNIGKDTVIFTVDIVLTTSNSTTTNSSSFSDVFFLFLSLSTMVVLTRRWKKE